MADDAPGTVGKDATKPRSTDELSEPPADAGPANAAPKPRPRRGRRWFWLGLPLLLALLVWFAPAIVASTDLRHRVLPLLLPDYPAGIETGGADLGWLSPVVLRDVTFRDLEGEPLLEVEAIETSKSLWELATQTGDVGRLRVVAPVAHVRARRDGSNVEDVVARYLESAAGRPPAGRLGVEVEVVDGRIELGEGTSEPTGIVELTRVELVRPLDPETDTTLHVEGRLDDGERSGTIGLHVDLRDDETGLADLQSRFVAKDAPLAALGPLAARLHPDGAFAGRLQADVRVLLEPPSAEPDGSDGSDEPAPRSFATRVQAAVTHLAARWPGMIADERLLLERLTLRGDVRTSADAIAVQGLELVTDVGDLRFDGVVPTDVALDAISVRELLDTITRTRHRLVANVDLTELVTVLPKTTRARDDLRLDSGTVELVSTTGRLEGRRAWRLDGRIDDLVGRVGNTNVRWDEPLSASILVPVTDRGPEIERFTTRSSFARITGRRSGRGVNVDVDCDLDRLERELARFVDLGDVELAGRIRGDGAITEEAGRWRARFDLAAERFVLAWPRRPRWTEPKLDLTIAAVGRSGEAALVEHVETGHLELVAGDDRLELRLTDGVPWNGTPETATWPVAFEMTGELQRWQTRLGPFVSFDDWRARGVANVNGSGAFAADRIRLDTCKGDVRDLVVTGPGVRVVEPKVTVDGRGEWNAAKGYVTSPSAVVASRTAAVKAVDLRCDWAAGGPPKMQGGLALRADLAGVQRWVEREPSVHGQLTGNAKFQHADSVTKSLWNVGLANLTGTTPGTSLDPDPIRLAGRIDYHHVRDIVAARDVTVTATGLAAKLNGRATDVSTAPIADVRGDLTYDWQRLAPRLRTYLGEVTVAGSGSRPFSLKGPVDFSNGIPATLVASGGLGWDAINAHGLPVGPGTVTANVADGNASFAPIDTTIAGGRFHTTPAITTVNGGSVLTLSSDTTLTDVELTPELTNQWLGLAAPLLANGARAEGRVSAALSRTAVPLANWQSMDATGTVRIDEARVTPGPMASQLVAIVERVRSLTGGGIGVPRDTTIDASAQTVNVRVAGGRVVHDRFTVSIAGIPVTTSGSVGFDNSVDLVARFAVPDEWVGDDRIGRMLAGRTLQIPIRGTTSSPQVDGSFLGNLATEAATDTIRERVGDKLNEEIGRGLERLLGPRR